MKTITFSELSPGDQFLSSRTGARKCTRLDGLYKSKFGSTPNLNVFVEGDEFSPPTLAHFDDDAHVFRKDDSEQRVKEFKRDFDAAHTLA
ncbi:MAG: hypothetical protein Q7R88_02190 [bacterium]|nr:hypothetical protein [bacterium]